MSATTVIIPTSPIPIHPSTEILERVIASIRKQLSDSEIIILCDDVRPEVEHRRAQYQKYLEGMMKVCADYSRHVSQVLFFTPMQQAGMLKAILPTVKTPNIFFCEHDAVLSDKPIPWDTFHWMLANGAANTIRLYWNDVIHPEHEYLQRGREGDFVKTVQWSGWPFIARTDFYRELMKRYFPDGDDCKMLETTLYSPVVESPWEDFKTVIYCPQPDAIRFTHLNARVDPATGIKDEGSW